MISEITAQELADNMKKGSVILIDVREPNEFDAGHIDGAILIPLSVFAQKFNRADYPSDKQIVLQCQGGVRSMKACQIAQELCCDDNFINLQGGLNAWRECF